MKILATSVVVYTKLFQEITSGIFWNSVHLRILLYLELFPIAVFPDFDENLDCRAKGKPLYCFKF